MKNSKFKKVISIILLLLVLFNVGSQTFAAINTTYGDPTPVDDFQVEEKLKSSSLMDPIAKFFYSIASWLEGLIGGVFESLTGTNEFPWADKVIFNTVAFLDVNFLNPAPGSLFLTSKNSDTPLTETPLATIVQKSYSTVMVLCIGFLGVIVGIMAVKLAITTIAAERAKYKQAIVQFATSLVLLFCMHYGISLIFYVNEQIVIVASQMLEDNIEESNIKINLELNNVLDSETLVENFMAKNIGVGLSADKRSYIEENYEIAAYLLRHDEYVNVRIEHAAGSGNNGFIEYWITGAFNEEAALITLYKDISIIKGENGTEGDLEKIREVLNIGNVNDERMLKTQIYFEMLEKQEGIISSVADKILEIFGVQTAEEAREKKEEIALDSINELMPSYKVMLNAHNRYVLKPGDEGYVDPNRGVEPLQIITDMATFFKESAWTYETDKDGNVTGWTASKINYEGAFLYVIFFVQSLAFFIAYIKRFFYVVILALLAPAVILYDFFVKSLAL